MKELDPKRLAAIVSGIPDARVLVIGDAMLDVYVTGTVERISPEAPVPVVRVRGERRSLGGAANVAHNVVALGGQCSLIACIGADGPGAELREELTSRGITVGGAPSEPDRPTSVKTRIMVRNQQVARYDREVDGEVEPATARGLVEAIERSAPEADAIVLEDYDKGVLVPVVIGAALDVGRRRGIPIVVDPKARNFHDYGGATVFKPNLPELAAALRSPVVADDHAWMERTRRHLECDHLLVTLGSDGMALMTAEGDYVRIPAVARSVFDVSGAGDTVSAVLAAALAAGATVQEAAVLANHAAGVEVGKSGVAAVTALELEEAALESMDNSNRNRSE